VHVLTKLFVVVAALLSVGLAALTMAYATSADRIVAEYRSEQARRVGAEAALSAAEAQHAEFRELTTARISSLQAEVTAQKGKNNDLTNEVAVLRKEKREAQDRSATIEARIAALGEATKTQAALIDSYRGEVTTLRDNELKYRNEALDYEDRINDLVSAKEVLEQQFRALQEQFQEFQQRYAGSETFTPEEGARVGARGAVQEVMDDVSGSTMARIDMGTNDGISEGKQLYVVRGNEFLGHLKVVRTDRRWSIGTFDSLGQSTKIRKGDSVLTQLK